MCKPASFIVTKSKVFFSKKSDSHEEIIKEFGLNEGVGRINFVRTEVTSEDLSLPFEKWKFVVDQTELPDWFDVIEAEKQCRALLPEWAKVKLTGWKVKEAFNPVNPLKIKAKKLSEKEAKKLVKQWDSVRDSVRDSVWFSVRDSVWFSVVDSVEASVRAYIGGLFPNSVMASVMASVVDSVRDSVGDSVVDSVRAYIGGLFPNITDWKYVKGKNPWKPLTTLWYKGYIPSFDGTTWRLHSGEEAKVVYSWKKEDL